MCENQEPSYYFCVFFSSALMTYALYIGVYKFLALVYKDKFDAIKEVTDKQTGEKIDKRPYVAKNVAKSILLCCISLMGIPFALYPILVDDVWCSHIMRTIAAIYGSIDFMALIVVPNLPQTTIIHHVVSTALIFTSFFVPFEGINISRLLAIYAILSTYAFSVNMYLGMKWLGVYNRLRVFAMYNYILCCAINWSLILFTIHSHYTLGGLTFWYVIVLTLMMGLVRDDLILIKWLYNDDQKRKKVE